MEKKKIKNFIRNLDTKITPTWCPGCLNFSILYSLKKAIKELIEEKKAKQEKFVLVSGIGCHGKIVDYINVSSFYSIHGRTLPTAIGIKLAKPNLKVIAIAGDGDAYSEGIAHLIHAAKYNADVTQIVHNNQVFALTTGQHTATSEKGFRSKSLSFPKKDSPLNPIKLLLSIPASFVARAYAGDMEHLKGIIKQAVLHKGFSFIDVLQPCLAFNDTRKFFNKMIYKIKPMDLEKARKKAREWNYSLNGKVAIGIFFKQKMPTLEEKYL